MVDSIAMRQSKPDDKLASDNDIDAAIEAIFLEIVESYISLIDKKTSELSESGYLKLTQTYALHLTPLMRLISRMINIFASIDPNPPKKAMELIGVVNRSIDHMTSFEYAEILKSKQEAH